MSILVALKLSLKIIVGLVRKKEKNELEKKQLAHVRNFAPRHYGRVKSAKKSI